jgi:hypothetical protein
MQLAIEDVHRSETPSVLPDVNYRTNAIVTDLRRLQNIVSTGEVGCAEVAFSGFLSPLAICEDEVDNGLVFREEKRAVEDLIKRECVFRAIICPVNEQTNPPTGSTIPLTRQRTMSLINYLKRPEAEGDCVELAVSRVLQKNLYVIGNISCIEGFRLGPGEFMLSLRQTGVDVVSASRQLFNVMFDRLANTPISTLPLRSPKRQEERNKLRTMAIERLEVSLKCLVVTKEIIMEFVLQEMGLAARDSACKRPCSRPTVRRMMAMGRNASALVIARRIPAFAFTSGRRFVTKLNPEARSKASKRRTTAASCRARFSQRALVSSASCRSWPTGSVVTTGRRPRRRQVETVERGI